MTQVHGGAQRVAFFGGSFDPPHLGHLAVARAARDALQLDAILFAPVGAQPLKPAGSTASFENRLAMTQLAIDDVPGFALSRIDAPNLQGKPNYTLHTLRRLHSELPNAELFCLMGADSFVSLRRWHGAAQIPFAANLVVASRPGESLEHIEAGIPEGLTVAPADPPTPSAVPRIELRTYTLHNAEGKAAPFYVLPGLDVEISATDIRADIRSAPADQSARPLIPDAVARYIREHGLYR
jgi:nicotinate-nucleotide adenylyltransferase